MPSIDYSKVVIYKIVCKTFNIDMCYVGHTTNFTHRKSSHKRNALNEESPFYNIKVYQTIRDNGGWENWDMIEIEKYPCNDFNEARARERYWYEILNSELNSRKPHVTQEERKEYNNKYNEDYNPIYYENYREKVKAKVKEYADNNKDLIQYRNKLYREKNKIEIQQRKSTLIQCECGLMATSSHFQRHRRTKLHQQLMEDKKSL